MIANAITLNPRQTYPHHLVAGLRTQGVDQRSGDAGVSIPLAQNATYSSVRGLVGLNRGPSVEYGCWYGNAPDGSKNTKIRPNRASCNGVHFIQGCLCSRKGSTDFLKLANSDEIPLTSSVSSQIR